MPKELLLESGAGVPPKITVGTGMEEPHEPTDADLFWALHNQPLERLPGLDAILDKYDLPPTNPQVSVPRTGLKRFMDKARKLRLVQKPEALSIRQYIGAILP